MWNLINFRICLIDSFLKDGHEIYALAPFDGHEKTLKEKGVKVRDLKMQPNRQNPIQDFWLIYRLRKEFKSIKPSFILSFTIKNNIYGAIASRKLDLKFIPNVTGLGSIFLSGWIKRTLAETLYRIAFTNLDTIFFQNHDDAKMFISQHLVKSNQVKYLPGSGINLEKFHSNPTQSNKVTFLMIARLIREKGVEEYIHAAKTLSACKSDITFQLMGPLGKDNPSGISEERLSMWIAEGYIEYLGVTDDVRPYIARASCVVLPSYREGAPRVLIEAAAMARPSISTNVPGCNSVVDHMKTGILVEVKNKQSLLEGMINFVEMNAIDRRKMGIRARKKAESKFNENNVIAAYKSAMAPS